MAKAKAKKTAKKTAKKDVKLGREGTAANLIKTLLTKGVEVEKIAKLAQKKFPEAKSTEVRHVMWYRSRMRAEGVRV